jgi:hypothetical protein
MKTNHKSCYTLRLREPSGRLKAHDFFTNDILKELKKFNLLNGCELVSLRQTIRKLEE